MHKLVMLLVVPALIASVGAVRVRAQHTDIELLSIADGTGALTSDYDFDRPIRLSDSLGFCPGGQCRYVSTNPGFVTPADDARGLFALAPGTAVSLEIVAIDDGASVKVGSAILDDPDESVNLGSAPGLHNHPEWTLILPEGVSGQYEVSFRLTTTAAAYADSGVFTALLTNLPSEPTPTATPTPTLSLPTATATASPTPTPGSPTATRVPAACVGDCDGDGRVSVNELVQGVNVALGAALLDRCPDLDASADGRITVDELVQAVRALLAGCVGGQ